MVEIPNVDARQVTLGPEFIFRDLQISELTPELQSRFGLSFSSKGLIVLDPGRIASRLSLRKGDVLREINRKPVDTIEDAVSAISSIKSSGSITIIRSGRRVSLRFIF